MHAYEKKRERASLYPLHNYFVTPTRLQISCLCYFCFSFALIDHPIHMKHTQKSYFNKEILKNYFQSVENNVGTKYSVPTSHIVHYIVPFALSLLVAQVSQSSALRCARTQRKLRELLLWQRLSCGICCHCLFLSHFLKSVLNYFLLFIYLFLYFSSVLNDKHFTHHSLNTKHFINKNDIL